MNRAVIFGDIHANLAALDAVLADMRARGFEEREMYCLGDLVGYSTFPNEVVQVIRERNTPRSSRTSRGVAAGMHLPRAEASPWSSGGVRIGSSRCRPGSGWRQEQFSCHASAGWRVAARRILDKHR